MLRHSALWLVFAPAVTGVLQAQAEVSPGAHRVRVNGAELSYVEQGAGPPVVFVHGAFSDARFWEPQRTAVAARYRFIAYTYRYHGTAPWPDDGRRYSATTHAADLVAFLRQLRVGPVHLVGLSAGGLLAALVASEHPDLVRSLILAEPNLAALLAESREGRAVRDERERASEPIRAAAKAGDAIRATALFVEWVNNRGVGTFDTEPEPVRRMALENARTIPLLLSAPPPPALSCATLGSVRAPTLVVGGERTRRYFTLINEAVVRCIPGSRLVTIPDATHLMSHQNATKFNEALLGFLAKQ